MKKESQFSKAIRKIFLLACLLMTTSIPLLAFPGTASLNCDSPIGSKDPIKININYTFSGDAPSSLKIIAVGKKYETASEGKIKNLIFLNFIADKEFVVSYESEEISFALWALPQTVKLSVEGEPYLYGKAEFKTHWVRNNRGSGPVTPLDLNDDTLLSCKLAWQSGGAG